MHAQKISWIHTREYIENVIVPCTNRRATSEGAGIGGTIYKDYVAFDADEVYKMFGLLFANGVSPKPQFDYWFLSSMESRLFGNDYIGAALDKKVGNRIIKGTYT